MTTLEWLDIAIKLASAGADGMARLRGLRARVAERVARGEPNALTEVERKALLSGALDAIDDALGVP